MADRTPAYDPAATEALRRGGDGHNLGGVKWVHGACYAKCLHCGQSDGYGPWSPICPAADPTAALNWGSEWLDGSVNDPSRESSNE